MPSTGVTSRRSLRAAPTLRRLLLAVDHEEHTELVRLRAELEIARAELREAELQLAVLGGVDGATGLPNRRGVIDAIEASANRLDRTGEGFAVLHLSVPALAELGPDLGEGVRHVASLLRATLRGVDRVGRFTDTAFAAVLAQADAAGVHVVAERVGTVLASLPLRTSAGEVVLTSGFAAVVVAARPAPPVDEIVEALVEAAGRVVPGGDPIIAVGP